jgi:hypothetical protein
VLPVRPLSLALVAALAFAPLLPSEHVHEAEENGHTHVVVHQHAHAHPIGHLPAHSDRRGIVDHPDDPVLTLSRVFVVPIPHIFFAPACALIAVADWQQPAATAREALMGLLEHPIHGPPRPVPTLRGPPTCPSELA